MKFRCFPVFSWRAARAMVATLSLVACARTSVSQTPEQQRHSLASKPETCGAQVVRSVPPLTGYTELGRVEFHGPGGLVAPTRATVEGELSKRACELGADAVLVERERYGSTGSMNDTDVYGIAILYAGAPPRPGTHGGKRPTILGTCFAIGARGHIATAEHVIRDAGPVTVQFPGKAPLPATVLTSRRETDVAILQVDAETPDYLPLVASASVANAGTKVFTFGFPVADFLGSEPKFTDGAVSALSGLRGEPRVLQMTVPIQPGNSGGPLVTETGFAIGIVTSSASSLPFLKATGSLPQGINWAVKADQVLQLLKRSPEAPPPVDRDAAVERARRAVCAIGPAVTE